MKGIIVNYRGSHKTQNTGQVIVKTEAKTKEDAKELVGKKIIWETPSGKKMEGKISAPHGNTGSVRAILKKGLPGQALGGEVEIK